MCYLVTIHKLLSSARALLLVLCLLVPIAVAGNEADGDAHNSDADLSERAAVFPLQYADDSQLRRMINDAMPGEPIREIAFDRLELVEF